VGFPLPKAVSAKETTVSWNGTDGKGLAQAHFSTSHQVMNGLGQRIQILRHAFNLREGLKPADFNIPPRMFGGGDGKLTSGPLRDSVVPIEALRRDYHAAMGWNHETGRIARARAAALGMEELLDGFVEG
jgi:aldehyde:ferredoxin oxidoreductase